MAQIFQDGLSFSGFERNKVFLGVEGGARYLDVSDVSGADTEADCRAVIVGDFDDDGDPDLFVNAIQRDAHYLFRNDLGSGSGFIKVRLRATSGAPSAIGATVRAKYGNRIQAQVLSAGSGYASQNPNELIFGLGPAESAGVEVRWPGGSVESFGILPAGGRYLLVQGEGAAQTYSARTFRFDEPPVSGVKFRVGDRLTDLALTDLEGKPRKYAVDGDRPLILNFWATSCRACVLELPVLEKVRASGAARVLLVSLESVERVTRMKALAERQNAKLDMALATDALVSELLDPARLAIPLTVWVSAEGVVERVASGRVRETDF